MARRVKTGAGSSDYPNIFADIALLGNLANKEGEIAPEDFVGTSQEPTNYNDILGTSKFGDVRQNQDPYQQNMQRIAQLPLAMSNNQDVRQDALDNMQPPLPFSGATNSLPETQSGKLQDPLEFIRTRLAEDPSLAQYIPQETMAKLQSLQPNPEKAFEAPMPEVPVEPMVEPGAMPERKIIGHFRGVPQYEESSQQQPGMPEKQVIGHDKGVPQYEKPPQNVPVVPPNEPITENMVEDYPDQQPQAGSVERLATDEGLFKDLQNLSKSPIPQEQLDRAEKWESIVTKREDLLDAEERSLLNQAQSGQLTTFDKIALGIAIAAPILVALRFGTEAGIAAAGSGLKGFAEATANQSKLDQEKGMKSNQRLQDIQKEKLDLAEKKIDVDKKIMDSIPDKEARAFLKNKQPERFGDQIGIPTGDEGKALWLDANKFDASPEGVKRAREVIKDADETIGVMKDSNKVVNEVLDILDALPEGTGMWEAVKKNAQWIVSGGGNNPLGGSAPKIDVMGSDGKTRKVDALALLKQKVNLLQDLYNKQVLGGTRLTGNVISHWEGILGDPSSMMSWLSQDLNSFKDTTRSLKDILNSREVETLVGKGFLREPLESQFPSGSSKVQPSEEKLTNQMRANPEAFRNKVK